eukprot:augustus_masked-scaffold_33-processed-gene-3.64-mRNA-1 protein AED:1.00 eAED:1.00 QI:0/-1/0/0/-1/1/1/0/792
MTDLPSSQKIVLSSLECKLPVLSSKITIKDLQESLEIIEAKRLAHYKLPETPGYILAKKDEKPKKNIFVTVNEKIRDSRTMRNYIERHYLSEKKFVHFYGVLPERAAIYPDSPQLKDLKLRDRIILFDRVQTMNKVQNNLENYPLKTGLKTKLKKAGEGVCFEQKDFEQSYKNEDILPHDIARRWFKKLDNEVQCLYDANSLLQRGILVDIDKADVQFVNAAFELVRFKKYPTKPPEMDENGKLAKEDLENEKDLAFVESDPRYRSSRRRFMRVRNSVIKTYNKLCRKLDEPPPPVPLFYSERPLDDQVTLPVREKLERAVIESSPPPPVVMQPAARSVAAVSNSKSVKPFRQRNMVDAAPADDLRPVQSISPSKKLNGASPKSHRSEKSSVKSEKDVKKVSQGSPAPPIVLAVPLEAAPESNLGEDEERVKLLKERRDLKERRPDMLLFQEKQRGNDFTREYLESCGFVPSVHKSPLKSDADVPRSERKFKRHIDAVNLDHMLDDDRSTYYDLKKDNFHKKKVNGHKYKKSYDQKWKDVMEVLEEDVNAFSVMPHMSMLGHRAPSSCGNSLAMRGERHPGSILTYSPSAFNPYGFDDANERNEAARLDLDAAAKKEKYKHSTTADSYPYRSRIEIVLPRPTYSRRLDDWQKNYDKNSSKSLVGRPKKEKNVVVEKKEEAKSRRSSQQDSLLSGKVGEIFNTVQKSVRNLLSEGAKSIRGDEGAKESFPKEVGKPVDEAEKVVQEKLSLIGSKLGSKGGREEKATTVGETVVGPLRDVRSKSISDANKNIDC